MRRVHVLQSIILSLLLIFLTACGGVTEKGDPITAESPSVDSSIYLQSKDADNNQETFTIEGPTSTQLNSETFKTLWIVKKYYTDELGREQFTETEERVYGTKSFFYEYTASAEDSEFFYITVAFESYDYEREYVTNGPFIWKLNDSREWVVHVDSNQDAPVWQGNALIRHQNDLLALEGFSTIQGNLYITKSSMITGLDNLLELADIDGKLIITENSALVSLAGLEGLSTVNGSVQIDFNEQLVDINALKNTMSINGGLQLYWNDNLLSIEGLSGLSAFSGDVKMAVNRKLKNFDGLENITYIAGKFQADTNSEITDIEGLRNVETIDGSLILTMNGDLSNVDGLRNLTHVGGQVLIRQNDSLTNIDGLNELASVGGDLTIASINNLESLQGLEGLVTVSGSVELTRNPKIVDLSGLEQLESVEGFSIQFMSSLISIEALANTSTNGGVIIYSNPSLESMNGLENLTDLQHLWVSYNNALESVQGLSGMVAVENDLRINGNELLCNDLALIVQDKILGNGGVGGDITISQNKECQ